MKHKKITTTLILLATLLCGASISFASSAAPSVTCGEIEPDFYRCVTTNMGSGQVSWAAPDDILVYPSGGVGSTMALIRDRDINGCIVAVASGKNGTARFSSCGNNQVPVIIDPIIIRPKVTCEEIEPDFYRCVTANMGSGQVSWIAPDDILVYPSGGVGSTMALIRDRDINGCIVAVASGKNGTARFSTCAN